MITDQHTARAARTPVLVVIPAHNEEQALPAVLRGLCALEPGVDVVVVDDGSTDDTSGVARAAGVPVLRLPFNLGIGGALRCGFRYAVERRYRTVIQFDGDGQHDPAEIGVLLEALGPGTDMVVGSRFAGAVHDYAVGRVRAGAMALLRVLVHQVSGHRFTDTSSGFRAFDRRILEFFAREYPAEYMESVEALVLALSAGFRVAEVPVRMTRRAGGRPTNRRLRLTYHFLRASLMILASARRPPPPGRDVPVRPGAMARWGARRGT